MRIKKIDLIKKIYDCDLLKGLFIVKLSIKKYTDIFNDLDPSPFKRRDIDQDVSNYIDECSEDIPGKYNLKLQFLLDNEQKDPEKEERIRTGLRTYFTYSYLYHNKEIHNSYKKSTSWILTSVILIILSFYADTIMPDNIITNTFIEGLSIGGWVFLWEAIGLMLFKVRDSKIKCRHYKRLEKSALEFIYNI